MKRILAVLTAVFAFTFLSAAQTGGASGSSGGQSGTADKSGEHAMHKKGGGGATLTGCLSGPNSEGVYELKSGKRTVEVGGLDDLSKHVGHEVRLHGSWAKSGSEIGEKEGNEAAEKNEASEKKGGNEEKGERHFKVSSIDHISDTCKGGAAGTGDHHHKKGSSSGSSGTSQPSTPPKL
jgi:hypothetical protein